MLTGSCRCSDVTHLILLILISSSPHSFSSPNIPITPRTTSISTELTAALPYQPPHPSPQTPYHRYTLLLIRQPSSTPLTPSVPDDRSSFILRDWLSENGFGNPAEAVRGIHMFREGGKGFGKELRDIADEHKKEVDAVSRIYSEVLGMCSARRLSMKRI